MPDEGCTDEEGYRVAPADVDFCSRWRFVVMFIMSERIFYWFCPEDPAFACACTWGWLY